MSIEDQISDPQTIDFWRRYFEEEEGERNNTTFEDDQLRSTGPRTAGNKLQDALRTQNRPSPYAKQYDDRNKLVVSIDQFCDAVQ